VEEDEEKIRLKQYVSLRSKGRHNYDSTEDLYDPLTQQFYSETNVNLNQSSTSYCMQ
jgi:hypothetical protein